MRRLRAGKIKGNWSWKKERHYNLPLLIFYFSESYMRVQWCVWVVTLHFRVIGKRSKKERKGESERASVALFQAGGPACHPHSTKRKIIKGLRLGVEESEDGPRGAAESREVAPLPQLYSISLSVGLAGVRPIRPVHASFSRCVISPIFVSI